MTTAFVLPGGASLGATQAGMLLALRDAGVMPDLLVGSSVGAINAAYLGIHPGPDGVDGLAQLWSSLRRRGLLHLGPVHVVLALAGQRQALFTRSGLERLLNAELGDAFLEDLAPTVAVVATDLLDGSAVVLREGPVVPAVLASSAMPGVLDPVQWDGRWLVDGSVAADLPVVQAAELGSDDIWVLTTSTRPARPPRGALDVAVHAFSLATGTATAGQLDRARSKARVHVLPPVLEGGPGVFDFSRGAQLVAEARRRTAAWLDRHAPSQARPASEPV